MRVSRRELLQTGIAGAVLLALADCGRPSQQRPNVADPSYTYRVLGPADRVMLAAVASAMLAGALPAGSQALIATIRGIDVAVAGLLPGMVAEVRQLFGLLEFPPTRAFAAGLWHGWDALSDAEVAAFLERWRFSGVTLFRSGYQALHQLVMSAWYGQNAAWARIGYPGPPIVN